MSPEIVPTRIMSRSSGLTCARFSASSPARVQRSEKCSPSATMCRSRIPVRVVIHSSEVSTSLSRSALERIRFGTAAPVPRILARITTELLRLRQPLFARVELGDLGLDLLGEVATRELRGEADRVLDGLGRGPPVADDHAALDAEQRRPAVFGVVEARLEAAEGRARQQETHRGLQRALDLLAQEVLDHLGERLGHLQDDVAGEAVGDDDVDGSVEDVAPLDVADEVQAGLLEDLEGLL